MSNERNRIKTKKRGEAEIWEKRTEDEEMKERRGRE